MKDYRTLLTKDQIYHSINNSQDNNPDFGKVLSESFSFLFKDIGIQALICFFLLATSFIPFITPFIMGGWFIYIHKKKHENFASFSDVFSGFQHGGLLAFYMIQMFVYALLIGIMAVIGYGLFESMNISESTEEDIITLFIVFGLLIMMPFYYVLQVFFFFSNFFFIFSDMSIGEAMNASFSVAKKKFWKIFLVVFVVGMIAGLGTNFCYIGLLFTYPFGFIAYYIYFEKFFKLEEEKVDDGIDDILEHLV